jgi:WhiB family transcriptional regulator, redox-sensing transcriptional regulator
MPDHVRAAGDAGVAAPRPAPGPWAVQASCRGVEPEVFFPSKGNRSEALAKQTCARCPVRTECLEHAVAVGEPFGIWGGMSINERRRYGRGAA